MDFASFFVEAIENIKLHRVPKKWYTKLVLITLSILNRFS